MSARLLTALLAVAGVAYAKKPPFNVVEATIPQMQTALKERRVTSRELVTQYLVRLAVKEDIQTTNMPTTGGALAFDGFVPPYEATLVKNLRDAGAIIIAKTGMTELATWVAGDPTPM